MEACLGYPPERESREGRSDTSKLGMAWQEWHARGLAAVVWDPWFQILLYSRRLENMHSRQTFHMSDLPNEMWPHVRFLFRKFLSEFWEQTIRNNRKRCIELLDNESPLYVFPNPNLIGSYLLLRFFSWFGNHTNHTVLVFLLHQSHHCSFLDRNAVKTSI